MATKNFTQFNTATPLTTSDYIVGYNAAGTNEIKTQVQSIINLIGGTDSQTLSFNEANNNLTISSGNTVSLSGLSDKTIINTVSSQLVTNTDFNSYKTNVASATASNISYVHTNFLPLSGSSTAGSLTAISLFTTGSGNVLIDRGNYRINEDSTIILGANSDQHLRFRAGGDTNSEIRMTILSSGEVGIGTTLLETAAAGNGGLRVKNNLLVDGDTTLTGSLSVQGTTTYIDTAVQVTSAMFIDTTSTETALRITQKGSGDVIRVEDSANPDITPFIVKSDGLVGIGTDSPNNALTVVGTVSTSNHGTSEQWNSVYTTVASSSTSNIVVQGNARGANISIGTNDAYHLRLKTNSSAKFTVLSSGDVGVGTTLVQTNPGSQLSQIINGSFTDTTGMAFNGTDWYGGTVPNWLGPTDATYTVYFNGGNYFRNLGTGTSSGTNSMRQLLGLLPVTSNIFVTFANAFVPFGSATLSAAIYSDTFTVLASGAFNSLGTYTLSAQNVSAGTSILIGFWGTAGITNISVAAVNSNPYLTVNGSISAKELIRAVGGNSNNWNTAFATGTTYQSNSGFYVQSRSTLETPTTGISAINNIVVLTQATYDALTVKLPTTMYVIISA